MRILGIDYGDARTGLSISGSFRLSCRFAERHP